MEDDANGHLSGARKPQDPSQSAGQPNPEGPQGSPQTPGPLQTPEKTAQVAACIDDPCDEGGYDQFCRDAHGELCQFHLEHCHAPDYPCLDLLRHHLAVEFLEEISLRRSAERMGAQAAANDAAATATRPQPKRP